MIRYVAYGLLSLVILAGCGDGRPPMAAPVEGKVIYRGKPLAFGSVMFQPAQGQPARGVIKPDGTFTLWTYEEGDGAAIGHHKVRITCYDNQNPDQTQDPNQEPTAGKSLIPEKYTLFDESGIEVDVQSENEPFVFQLKD